jgi:hypothetical protein
MSHGIDGSLGAERRNLDLQKALDGDRASDH